MKRLVVTAAAEEDLRAVGRYTAESWGLEQKARYLAQFRKRFLQIRKTPEIGRARDEIRPGYRSILAGRHVIFYQETDELIEVVRILHDRMDLHRQFADPEPRSA